GAVHGGVGAGEGDGFGVGQVGEVADEAGHALRFWCATEVGGPSGRGTEDEAGGDVELAYLTGERLCVGVVADPVEHVGVGASDLAQRGAEIAVAACKGRLESFS